MRQYRNIPDTDLYLSPMGFGTVDAGVKWDIKEGIRLLDTFFSTGGNLVDTARVYSDWIPGERGRAERVLGQCLKEMGKRDQVILATKGGHPEMAIEHPDMHQNRLTRACMEEDLNLSLQALQTDYIDIYFYHRDQESIPVEELVETMENFVRAGKIRYYGCSNWSTKRMEEADNYANARGYRGFVANQALFNTGCRFMKPMADDTLKTADEAMQAYHRTNPGNILMPYTGNCGGFFQLLETRGEDAVKNSPYFTTQNLKLAEKFKKIKENYHASMTQVVLGFFTCQDFPCVPLYAAAQPERMKSAMESFDLPFNKEDFLL